MKMNIASRDYYINLPKQLYIDLKASLKEAEHINSDLAAFLLYLIIQSNFKDKENKNDGWAYLCYGILKYYDNSTHKHPAHFKFLEEKGFIDRKPHIKNVKGKNNTCAGYRIKDCYLNENGLSSKSVSDNSTEYIKHYLADGKIKRSHRKQIKRRQIETQSSTPHLTKWLDSTGFTLKEKEAKEYINQKYALLDDERESRLFDIESFESSLKEYSREGKDDRLHSFFVKCASDIKQFIRFNSLPLKEIDIKSSQPYIFTYILIVLLNTVSRYNDIKQGAKELKTLFSRLINNTGKGYYYNKKYYKIELDEMLPSTIMTIKTLKSTDIAEINRFIKLVRDGDIYDYVGEELLSRGSIEFVNGKYVTILNVEVRKGHYELQEVKEDILRDIAKKITLNALYSSHKNNEVVALNHFFALFPSVTKILKALKKVNYKNLPILMQRIEAKFILDYCSKRIAKKHPDMLLISRHDSLSTTIDKFDILKEEFKVLMGNYFNIDKNLIEQRIDESNW